MEVLHSWGLSQNTLGLGEAPATRNSDYFTHPEFGVGRLSEGHRGQSKAVAPLSAAAFGFFLTQQQFSDFTLTCQFVPDE